MVAPLAVRLDEAAHRGLQDVLRLLDAPRERVRLCAEAFASIHHAARDAGRRMRRDDLAALAGLLHETLRELPGGVDGAGVVLAEGLLDDAPLFLEWWRRTPGGGAERLDVSYDPEDPAAFYYPDAEWFAVPMQRGGPWIAGPFVDSGGTNRHLCTYSVPVHGGDGTFLGIAGADLRVGYVERAARRALAALDARAVLVNREERVIACNEPGLAAGALLGPLGLRRSATAWDAQLPWGVAVTPRPG